MAKRNGMRSFLAGLCALGAGAVNQARAGWDVGADINLGIESLNVTSPQAGQSITVSGYTGTGMNGNPRTYTLNVPRKNRFNMFSFGITPYIQYVSEDESFARDFKLGVEFAGRYNTDSSTREGDETFFYADITDNNWSPWPNAAVIGELSQQNLGVLEKPVTGFKEKDTLARLSLIARLDKYNIRNRATTARVPYGSEWYGTYQNTITSSQDLGEEDGLMMSAGIRGTFEGKMARFFGFSISLELLHGLPFGDVYPGLSGRLNAGYKF